MDEIAEADLGSVTDAEWLEAHAALSELVADDPDFPNEELTFIYDPDLDPRTLIADDEVDHGPGSDHA